MVEGVLECRWDRLGAACDSATSSSWICPSWFCGTDLVLLLGGWSSAAGSPVFTGGVVLPVRVRGACTGDTRGASRGIGRPVVVVRETSLDSSRTSLVGTGLLFVLAVLGLLRLRIAVEVQIYYDVPGNFAVGECTSESEHFSGQQPPDETDGVTTFVVGWNGNVDKFGGGVGVAERNHRDVDIGGFLDGLGIGSRVRDNDQSWFAEGAGNVVGEVTGSESTGDSNSTSMSCEFEDCSLTVWSGGNDTDVGWVVDRGDDSSC